MRTIDLGQLVEAESGPERAWGLVLLVAVKDGASEVRFDAARRGKRLACVIEGTEHILLPPPLFMTAEIVRVMRQLLYGWLALGLARREGEFTLVVGGHQIAVKGTADSKPARVSLHWNAPPEAIAAARDAWQERTAAAVA